MAKRLLAESTDDWRASPKTARELVFTPTANFTMTTTILASRMPPRTRRTRDDFSPESAPLGMVEVGDRGAECQRFSGSHEARVASPDWRRGPRLDCLNNGTLQIARFRHGQQL